jgi:LmbE family N-acetylglucosaminyl deacetylase
MPVEGRISFQRVSNVLTEAATMPERALLLSPHSDDIVMSAFGIITKKLLPGPLGLLTVFSLSRTIMLKRRNLANLRMLANSLPRPNELAESLARNAGDFGKRPGKILQNLLDLRQPYKISRIRLLEDLSFSRRAGMRLSYLNFPDSKSRHGRAILDPNWPLANEDDVLGKLIPVLKNVISRMKVQIIAAPWPYGERQHIDHRLVNESAVRIAEDMGIGLFYLDDQPYSRRPIEKMVDVRGRQYTPVVTKLDPSEMSRKYSAMNLYSSQMVSEFFKAVRRPPPGSTHQYFSETLWQPSVEALPRS